MYMYCHLRCPDRGQGTGNLSALSKNGSDLMDSVMDHKSVHNAYGQDFNKSGYVI